LEVSLSETSKNFSNENVTNVTMGRART
jgi:hypothetical protein